VNENISKPAMTYDDLIKGYYGGRHHHGHGHHHRQHRGSLAKSAERLFASYYGKPPHRKRPAPAPAPALAVSYSVDDGEMLKHANGSAVFEEYVVQASPSESGIEEYVVERAPMAGEASSSEPHEEYRVDVADLLGSDSPNRFALRSPRAPAPASVAAPGPGSAPANGDWSAPSPVRSGEAGPVSASDDDFFADMQSILTREKVYDPVSKKTIDADKIGKNAAIDQPQAPNSQAIFDKIAQSMQYANTYDLGTVELENRFGDFDRTSDLQLKAEADKRRGRTQSMAPKPRVAAADVDSQDFIQDIDTMHRQRGPSPPPQVKDDDPFAYLPPESSGIADSADPGAGWADYRQAWPGASSAGAGVPASSSPGFPFPNIPIPNISIPGIPTPTLPMPWAAPSAPMTASTSTDLGGAFVASALQNTFGNAADINSYFATMGAADFVSWFNQNVAGQGPWAKRAIGTGPAVATNFQAIWNNIPQMFGTPQINLLQFLSLMSILINEVGETLAPIAERVGVKDHPGIAYAFDSIENLKVSYNDGGSNWTAYRCFNDADFIAAHGSKLLGDKLSNTTDTRWSGHEYPSGYPTDVNPAVNGFILEADFYKFRGRGLIQTTWRGAYQNLIRFVQGYTGTQAEILARTSAWMGMGVDKAVNVSANADWDALFMRTDLEIPCVAIAQHSSGAGNYLNLSGDVTVLNGTGQGSIWRIGKCISGGNAYADLFRRRVVAICNLLGN
jgi:hypothetical protein